MARTKEEIKDTIVTHLAGLGLSDSAFAVWEMFVDAVVSAIYTFESLLDIFYADIDQRIADKRIGSRSWYVEVAKEFQLGDSLVFTDDGQLLYDPVDESKQIIASASAIQVDEVLTLKVAKLLSGELAPLSNEELLQFNNYMLNVMIAGTNLNVVSLNADIIYLECDIYYNPIFSEIDVQADLDEALYLFNTTFEFDNYFILNDFIDYLRNYESMKDVVVNVATGTQGGSTTPIVREYELKSGYFNYDALNSYNLIKNTI